ncbi:MAG TPA: helix-hairpin-helix domain-containing protein [Noviherbaspirillum sp.]|nr:helix-hairpin-helix domain-containing protein [Noviherbaspirillum sp.]
MLKKVLMAVVMIAANGFAFAQVEVNKADQAALDGIRGIGPKTSKAILDERKAGGDFKDWSDLENRVNGVGNKSASRLSDAGLTVNGKPRASAAPHAAKDEKKTDTKKLAKKDASKDEQK